MVSNHDFQWCEKVTPTMDEIGNFVAIQDRVAGKVYTIDQITTTLLTRQRNKQINVLVHVYKRQLGIKIVHGQFDSKLLQPEQRDRATMH